MSVLQAVAGADAANFVVHWLALRFEFVPDPAQSCKLVNTVGGASTHGLCDSTVAPQSLPEGLQSDQQDRNPLTDADTEAQRAACPAVEPQPVEMLEEQRLTHQWRVWRVVDSKDGAVTTALCPHRVQGAFAFAEDSTLIYGADSVSVWIDP